MNSDPDPDLKALLNALMNDDVGDAEPDEEPEPQMSPFGLRLAAAVEGAIEQMRADGVLEVEDAVVDALVIEVTEAGLDSNSPKQLIKKVIKALLASDRVDEIYGTDEMLRNTLAGLLGAD